MYRLLTAWRFETDRDVRGTSVERRPAVAPLPKLPPGPTRSLGGYLDYAGWPDCERFLELDRALLAHSEDIEEHERNGETLTFRRCSERVRGRLRCQNRFRVSAEYIGPKCEEHRGR